MEESTGATPQDLAVEIVAALKAIVSKRGGRSAAEAIAREAPAALDLPTLAASLVGVREQVERGYPTQYGRLLALLKHPHVSNWFGGLRYDARKAARVVVADWIEAGEIEATEDALVFRAEQAAFRESSAKAKAEREAHELEVAARAEAAKERRARAPDFYDAEDNVPSMRAAIVRALTDRPGETANVLYARIKAPNQKRVGKVIDKMVEDKLIEEDEEPSTMASRRGKTVKYLRLADPLRGLGYSDLARHELNIHGLKAPSIRKRVVLKGMRPSEALAKPPTPSEDGRGGRRRGPSAA